ncbi:MAG: hypothetical protein U9Q66_04065, partial [Patescibacteria group bacterium]|nr:hypothetical protein [Patescibacteria group bacterium]
MGYIVSTTFKQLENSKLGQSVGHDFRTSFTKNIRNNLENEVIDLNGFGSTKFISNENLINKNLEYKFDKLGKRFYEDEDISIYDENLQKEDLGKNIIGQKIYSEQMEKIESIKKEIKDDYKKHSKNNRSLPKQTKYFQEGIIYFGADEEQRSSRDIFDEDIEGLTDSEVDFIRSQKNKDMNEASRKFIKEFEKKNGCKVLYLIRHDDEKTPHYHFIFTNYNFNNHKSFNSNMKRADISQRNSEMQDLVGECFEAQNLPFHRGKKKEFANKQKTKNEKIISETNDNTIKLNNLLERLKVQTELLISRDTLNDELKQLEALKVQETDKIEDINKKTDIVNEKLEMLNQTLEKKIVNRKEYSNLSKNLIEDVFKNSYVQKNGKKSLLVQEVKKNFDIKLKSLKGVDIQIEELTQLKSENEILRKSNLEKLDLLQENQKLKTAAEIIENKYNELLHDSKDAIKVSKSDGHKLVDEM